MADAEKITKEGTAGQPPKPNQPGQPANAAPGGAEITEAYLQQMHEAFTAYAERMKQVRFLSAPSPERVVAPEDYSRILKDNFTRIGEMAGENRKVVADYIQPFLKSQEPLPEGVGREFRYLNELLVNDKSVSDTDVHLSELLTDRLFADEFKPDEAPDINARLLLLAKKIRRDYYVLSELSRGQFSGETMDMVRLRSTLILREVNSYLAYDRFPELTKECQGAVLLTSVFGMLIYMDFFELKPDAYYDELLALIHRAEEIFHDPFYHEVYPDYDWESYEFRIYYYAGFLANCRLNRKAAAEIYRYGQKLRAFLSECKNEGILRACSADRAENLLLSAGVKAGIVPVEKAGEIIYQAYEGRDPRDYSDAGISANLDTPSKYLALAMEEKMPLTERNIDRLNHTTRSMLNYLYRVPKLDNTTERCISLFLNMLVYHQELPGGMSMGELCLNAFAVLHPPTYVHVNIVARLTACITRHLLKIRPELFVAFPGTGSVEAVRAKEEEIHRFAYRAALYHDIGKLFILSIITMYGRAILDDEFSGIKTHPVIGAELAEKYESMRDYADIIRGHHIWYNGERGYPAGFDTAKSPYKTIIDIVMVADCLDAATDSIGRSYHSGKTFADYCREVSEGAGTRYAPYFPELFSRPECKSDIEYLLKDGRERMYRETYRLLKKMHQ